MQIEWTYLRPQKEGLFWYFGDPFWGSMNQAPSEFKPELCIVEVRKIQNGFMYVTHGNFMEEGHGAWSTEPIKEPEFPLIRPPAANG